MAALRYDIRRPDEAGGGFEQRWWSPINWPLLGPDGEVELIVHRVLDVTAYVEQTADVAEQLRRTAILEQRTSQMEAEILRRSRELELANHHLREANSARGSFLSRMSHELRTPLTAVIGFGELLELSALESEQSEWVALILRASRHLLELLNDVLDISRIDSGTLSLSLEPVALADVIIGAIELVQPLADSAGIQLGTTSAEVAGSYVLADQQRIRQVLVNLLSNAVKYNRPGGKVVLQAERADAGTIRIEVRDQGRGLAPGDLERLFIPFERLDAASRGIEGTGLGLALSKTLMESMGGSIGATSTPGEGSTFFLVLRSGDAQLSEPSDARTRRLVAERTYTEPKLVVYVEDVDANILLVTEILKRRPAIEVVSLRSGGGVSEICRARQPDLVLLDLHLPDIDGEEVLRRLRADPATSSIPVAMLSADATPSQVRKLTSLGADRYLTKPIGVADLLATVDELLLHDAFA